jgi:hypothetical protein
LSLGNQAQAQAPCGSDAFDNVSHERQILFFWLKLQPGFVREQQRGRRFERLEAAKTFS